MESKRKMTKKQKIAREANWQIARLYSAEAAIREACQRYCEDSSTFDKMKGPIRVLIEHVKNTRDERIRREG